MIPPERTLNIGLDLYKIKPLFSSRDHHPPNTNILLLRLISPPIAPNFLPPFKTQLSCYQALTFIYQAFSAVTQAVTNVVPLVVTQQSGFYFCFGNA